MRYIVLVTANPPAGPPPGALMEGIMKLGAEATASGALLDTAGLAPSTTGARVVAADGQLNVAAGPFGDDAELMSYAIYDVADKEAVLDWTSRFLRLHLEQWPGWKGEARVVKQLGPEDFA